MNCPGKDKKSSRVALYGTRLSQPVDLVGICGHAEKGNCKTHRQTVQKEDVPFIDSDSDLGSGHEQQVHIQIVVT